MSRKALALIAAVAVFVIAAISLSTRTSPKGRVIVNCTDEYAPETFYTFEFTAEKPGTLKVKLQALDSRAEIAWYICDVDKKTFNKALNEGWLSGIIYERGSGGASIQVEVDIDKSGTFTFAFVQVNRLLNSFKISVYLEFIPEG